MTGDASDEPRIDVDGSPTSEPVESPVPSRSLLPGVALVGVLLAGAVFAAGYRLGDSGAGSGGPGLQAIAEAYDRITTDFVGDVDPDTIVGAAIGAMFDSLGDPYSSYMGASRFDADLADVSGEFEGIGAQMASEDTGGAACEPIGDACRLLVIDVLADSPAAAAGLLDGDEVRAIDARPVAGLTIADAIGLIRGPRGTRIDLAVQRDGAEVDVGITRDLIRAQDVRSELLAEGRVGYLRVDTFSAGASDDFHARLREHLDAGIEDLVIDLRDDPGGFVDAAVTMASEFLADGIVYQEEQAGGDRLVVEARPGGLATNDAIEVVVLIDGGTASASEIVAGALGRRGRATLIGERTFGKGTIQEWTELPGDNGGFRLSIARWLLPDGSSIDGSGIAPDVNVDGSDAVAGATLGDDPVVRAAVDHLLSDEVDAADDPTRPAVSAVPGAAASPPPSPIPSS